MIPNDDFGGFEPLRLQVSLSEGAWAALRGKRVLTVS